MASSSEISELIRYLPINSFFGGRGKTEHISDMHCDCITLLSDGRSDRLINRHNFSEKYPQLQFTAVWCRPVENDDRGRESFRRALAQIETFYGALRREGDRIVGVRDGNGIEKAFAAGKHAALLTVEGGGVCLNGDVAALREFYSLGVRVFGLAWESNALAKSNRLAPGECDTGLSDAGKRFIREGNRIGMAFDVSHLSDQSCRDVLALSELPVFATHSNFRALCPHSRNLTDEDALRIAESGGMIGLNIYPEFISRDRGKQTLAQLREHLRHGISLVGAEHISLGMDIDGIERLPDGVDGSSSIVDRVVSELFER